MSIGTKLTAEEFLALPNAPGKQELLNGELITLPPARQQHNAIARRFYERLLAVLRSSRVWLETGYRLKSGWLQPDISVIWPDQPCGDWFEGSPMVAIVVASRGNRDDEIDRKIEQYLSNGALEVWIVRPETLDMLVHRNEGSIPYTGVYRCDTLAIEMDVQDLITGR